ncbi:MAG: hypothetical protein D6732_10140, partial [Methanobacteriota archaeon]
EDYVRSVASPEDEINDELLNSEDQVDFLIKGVQAEFSDVVEFSVILPDLLGDQFFFDTDVPNATYPSFEEIDKAEILRDNNSVDTYWSRVGTLRFLADDLVDRAMNRISWSSDAKKNEALFWGYLLGGYARYLYAVHWGLHETEPGGVIDGGPFVQQSEMLALAREKFNAALQVAPDAYWTRVVNSLLAKTYIVVNDYTNAATYAANGMVAGDAPFEALYNDVDDNYVWQQGGRLRTQVVVDPRFEAYITADPNEANRIQIEAITGNSGATYWRQIRYPEAGSPIPVMTWQENNLMLAEIALNGGTGDPVALVNEVRASHGLSALAAVDMNVLIEERDKELFVTGNRVIDQNRFNLPFTSPSVATMG